MNNHENDDDEEIVTCDVCFLDGEDTTNRILCCEMCNTTVHQACYSVEGSLARNAKWFCFPCKTGFQPDQLACALCSHTGGAYKKLAGDDKSWVHALCVNWIPEVFEIDGDIDKMGPRVNLSTLDKARLRLNCNFCSRKGGACVQCAYKKCQSAIHPMCLVKDSFDFTFRVVEGKNKKTQCDYYRREAFCPRHADFAGEPLKKDEIVIQLPSHSKFDIDDDYAPVLKEEYKDIVLPFKSAPTPTVCNTAENTPVPKNKRASSSVSAPSSAAKVVVGQKRKRATMGDTPLSPAVPVNLPRGVPSKRPKTTIVKAAAVSSGNAKASPSRTHSGIKRGPSSVHGVSSGSATSGSSSTSAHKRRESNQRIYSVLEQYSKSAQKKEDTGYSHQGRDPLRSRKSTGDSEADLAPIPTPVGASTPKRGARGSSTVEHMMVPPSPSLSSVASPDTRVAGSRSSRQQQLQQNQQQQRQSRISSVPEYISAAGEEDSAPNTPVPTRRSGGTGAGAGSVEVATNFSAPVGRFGTRSSGPSTTTTTAVEVRTPASSTRSTRFSPAGGNKEELLPGLPARSGGGKGKGGGTAQPAAALTALISSNGVVAGTIPTSAGPPTQAPGTVGVIPPYSYVGTSGAATSASAGAVGVGAIDPSAVQHLQALLQQVLVGLLPAALPATPSNSSSSPNGLADFSAPVRQDVVYHKFSASSLPESTWAELFKVGWRCITVDVTDQSTPATTNTTTTSASSSRRNNYNSGGGNGVQGEEIYLTPGTVLTSDAVRDFSRLRLRENVQYFNSLGAFRIHLAQNPALLHPWAATWQTLQQHGWRAHYVLRNLRRGGSVSAGARSFNGDGIGTQGGSDLEDGALPQPTCIYLSGETDQHLTDNRDPDADDTGGSDDSDGDYDHAYGAARRRLHRSGSGGRSSSGRGGGVTAASAPVFVSNCIDGVHRFKTWREFQCYIHRYPYMLQNDATFTNTLLVHGWRHRLYVKPEPQQSNQQRPRPHNGIPEGADFRNNSEFLWQGAHILPHSLEEEEEWNAVGEEARDGVWLRIDALRRHLWEEPTRLFLPYDRALSSLRVTSDRVPPLESLTAPTAVPSSSISSSSTAPAVTVEPAGVGARTSESEVQRLRAEFSTLLTEMAALKQSNVESQALSRKLESKLDRHRERRKQKKDRRQSSGSGGGDNHGCAATTGVGVAYRSNGASGSGGNGHGGEEEDQNQEQELDSDDGDTI